ncbi:MAG: hypothetical protein GXY44_06070 [Phycisphaerales bacterium]|nr:hypothetical protein [Phycisphaerales bacterium]
MGYSKHPLRGTWSRNDHHRSRKAGLAILLMLLGISTLVQGCSELKPRVIVVVDPYANIDWSSFGQYKANLHTHTTQSDGSLTPDQVIDEYHKRGYSILAITDHNLCTWPWTGFADMPRRGAARKSDVEAEEKEDAPAPYPPYENRDPEALGMLAVSGNELSRHHHMGCFFIEHETDSRDEDRSMVEIGEKGGLAMLYHPGRYWKVCEHNTIPAEVVKRYVDWLAAYEHLVGLEVVNQGRRYQNDIRLWDEVLTAMMPDRPVWGFSNDDMHGRGQLGRDWNTFVLVRLDEAELREALRGGQFYFSTIGTHPGESRNVAETPIIHSITHNHRAGTITLTATSGGEPLPETQYRWISEGRVVHTGPVLDYLRRDGIGRYVRAELVGNGGTTYTNPVGLRHP